MIFDIEFERFVSEIDADGFAAVSEAYGGVDWGCATYSVKDVTYKTVSGGKGEGEREYATEESTVLGIECSVLAEIDSASNDVTG